LQKGNAQRIVEASVESAPLYVTSIFQISCEQFDKNFTELKKVIQIKSNYFVNLNHLLHTSNSVVTRNGIDVRGKIVIKFDNNIIRNICFDEFGIFSEGTKYFKNKRLWDFILRNKLVES
jgi:hypothetical protein